MSGKNKKAPSERMGLSILKIPSSRNLLESSLLALYIANRDSGNNQEQ